MGKTIKVRVLNMSNKGVPFKTMLATLLENGS